MFTNEIYFPILRRCWSPSITTVYHAKPKKGKKFKFSSQSVQIWNISFCIKKYFHFLKIHFKIKDIFCIFLCISFFFKSIINLKIVRRKTKLKYFFYQSVHLKKGVKYILSMVHKICSLNVYICHKSSAVTHFYSFYLYASTYVYYC